MTDLVCSGSKNAPHNKRDGSWWEYDARGIALCRVCDKYRDAKLSRYNPWVLKGYDQAFLDEYSGERIEDDY